jgi:multidrug efflux system membrane fusion protein
MDRSNQTKLAEGTVMTVDNLIDATTGTVKVRAGFANRDFKLFPNQFVNARLLVNTFKGVNLIPTAAIQRDNDRAYVYVLHPNKTVQSHNINITHTEGARAAVTGVAPGDTLVTDGFDRLTDGAAVVVRQPADANVNTRNGTQNASGSPANELQTPGATSKGRPNKGTSSTSAR